jgi:uncharacterized protein with predicted RNA binding PUA domain
MHEGVDAAGLRTVADYQFGGGAGAALFPSGEERTIERSRTGRPRQVLVPAGRLVSVGGGDRFTLGVEGGRRLAATLDPPACRVVVGDESEPFVRDGDNVFAKFVTDADPAVRARDEVVVGHRDGTVLGVGRAAMDAGAMADFETGMAVRVRGGVGSTGEGE